MGIAVKHSRKEAALESPLLKNISGDEFEILFACLAGIEKYYDKNEYVFHAGDKVTKVGIVTSGYLDIVKDDIFGRRNIITTITKSGVFAEGIVAGKMEESPVSAIAAEKSSIVFLDYSKIIKRCERNCCFHNTLIDNMLGIMANKLIMLNEKLKYSQMKTIREKVIEYLAEQYQRTGKKSFEIIYSREGLSNYLNTDRSSLSRELSFMKRDGIIDYKKNRFVLLEGFFSYYENH